MAVTPRPKFGAPPWIGTIFYQSWEGQGFSETYYLLGATAESAMTKLGLVLTARKALFTDKNFVKFYRVSDGLIRGDTTVTFVAGGVLGTYADSEGRGTGDTNQALKMRVQCQGARFMMKYLHLIPNECISADGLALTVAFNTAFTAYKNALVENTIGMFAPNREGEDPDTAVPQPVLDIILFGLTTRRTGRPFGAPRGRTVIRF